MSEESDRLPDIDSTTEVARNAIRSADRSGLLDEMCPSSPRVRRWSASMPIGRRAFGGFKADRKSVV